MFKTNMLLPHGKYPEYRLEFYEENGKNPVKEWMRALDKPKKRLIGVALYSILQNQGLAVCQTEFGKQLKNGIFEFRVRDENSIALRVFCHAYGAKIILLLAAYDKGVKDSKSQQNKQIELAIKRLAKWKSRKL